MTKLQYTADGKRRHKEARAKQVRENSPRWKGKIMRCGYWYIFVPEHPYSSKQGYVAEHRLVMEKHLGRYLLPPETVHHINKDKLDNRIENLEIYPTRGQHTLHHPEVIQLMKTMNKGIRRSPQTEFKKGQKPWNTGRVLSSPRTCKITGCDRSAHYKDDGRNGLCSMHNQRKRKGKL